MKFPVRPRLPRDTSECFTRTARGTQERNEFSNMGAASVVSSLGFRRAKLVPNADGGAMTDDDYISWGKTSNSGELSGGETNPLFHLIEEEDGLDSLIDVPFGLKHLKDLHVVMRHSVAVAGDRREDLTRHPLFHPAFAAFALGFAIGLAQTHRLKQMGFRASTGRLSKSQLELCDQWGAEITTYFLAVVDAEGIFGKDSDADLYGISDRWRLLSDERRLDAFEGLTECLESGKRAAHRWFEDDTCDVPPYFLDALANFVDAYPNRAFE